MLRILAYWNQCIKNNKHFNIYNILYQDQQHACILYFLTASVILYKAPPTKKNQNYLLEGEPLVAQASPDRWVFRNTSVSVFQLVALWEAAFGFSELFLKTLSMHLPISWQVIYTRTCPHHVECLAVFDQKRYDLYTPPSLFTVSNSKQLFLFPWKKKKSSKGNILPVWKRWTNKKNGKSTIRHQNWWVQKLFWAVEKTSWYM